MAALKDPADPVLDWAEVRDALLAAIPKADRLRSARKGEFEGLRRLWVGHYRVVYEEQRSELVILAVRIGHRRGVDR